MELKLINLEKCFDEAIKQNRKIVGFTFGDTFASIEEDLIRGN